MSIEDPKYEQAIEGSAKKSKPLKIDPNKEIINIRISLLSLVAFLGLLISGTVFVVTSYYSLKEELSQATQKVQTMEAVLKDFIEDANGEISVMENLLRDLLVKDENLDGRLKVLEK